MEFLQLSRRRSSGRNVQSGEERGETDVFAGWAIGCWHRVFFSFVRSLLEEAIIEAVPLPRLSTLQFLQLNIHNSALQTEDLYYYSGFQLIKRIIVT